MQHLIESYEARTLFAGGVLDTSFGQDGYADLNLAAYSEKFTRVAAGPNNTIVVAGNVGTNEFVARYNLQGQLDTSFNGTGYVQINSNTGYSVTALSVLADGKVLIGTSQANNGVPGSVARITRLTSTGQLDNTWSGDGVWTGSWTGRLHSTVQGFVPQSDGSVIVAGDDGNSLLVRKLDASGTLVSGFLGQLTPPGTIYDGSCRADAFATQSGRIAIVGGYQPYGIGVVKRVIAMFKTDGTVDSSFDGDGFLSVNDAYGVSFYSGGTAAFDGSGRLIAGGAVAQQSSVIRLTTSGVPDTTFDGDGLLQNSSFGYMVTTAVPLDGGRMLIVSPTSYLQPDNAIFLTSTGSIDTTGGTNGITPVALGAFSGLRTSDGSIVLAGLEIAPYDRQDMRLAKLTAVTSPPPPPPTTGSISGVTFDDSNKNGQLDTGENKTSGKTVFLDSNNNGKLDTGEKSTTTSTTGAYTFIGLVAGTYYVRRVFPSGYTYSNLPLNLTLAGGQSITNANIGSVPVGTPPPPPPPNQTGSISGFTFDDKNKNGLLDTGETKTSGKTVFLDTNNNGKLDTGEKSTKTNTSGAYSFTSLTTGTYYVRRVFPSGYTYSNLPLDLALSAGQSITNANIGSIAGTVTPPPPPPGDPKTASISGFLFWDNDRDGKFDTGESYQASKIVFIDLDDDNVLDANETRLTTDSQGAFKFTGLSAGTYVIKRVVPSGYKITTPKPVVTLTAGQVFSGVAIGTNT